MIYLQVLEVGSICLVNELPLYKCNINCELAKFPLWSISEENNRRVIEQNTLNRFVRRLAENSPNSNLFLFQLPWRVFPPIGTVIFLTRTLTNPVSSSHFPSFELISKLMPFIFSAAMNMSTHRENICGRFQVVIGLTWILGSAQFSHPPGSSALRNH